MEQNNNFLDGITPDLEVQEMAIPKKYYVDYDTGEIIEIECTEENETKYKFEIDNDNKADWAVQKIKDEQAECDRLIQIAKDKIEDLKLTIKALEEQYDRKTHFLSSKLESYFNTVSKKETKTKLSYKLLSGTLEYIKPQAAMVVTDEIELMEQLKATGQTDFIKTKESVAWGELKKILTIDEAQDAAVNADGNKLRGITIEVSEGKFKIK